MGEKGQRLLICSNRVLTPAECSSKNPGTWLSLPNLKILLKLQKELTKKQMMLKLLLRMLKRKKRTQLKTKKKSDKPEEGLFTTKELESLERKITEVEKWRDDKLEEQEKQPLSEMPKLTVSLIKSKIQDLDSEVQLLIGKARMIKAERERAKRKAEEEKK